MLNVPVDVTVSLIVLVLDAPLGVTNTVLGIIVGVLSTVLSIIPSILDTLLGVVEAVLDIVLGVIVCALGTVLSILVAILDILPSTTSRSPGPVVVCVETPNCKIGVESTRVAPASVKDMLTSSTHKSQYRCCNAYWGRGRWTLIRRSKLSKTPI